MTSQNEFDPDDLILDGLSNYLMITQDKRDAEVAAYLFRDVAEVFRANVRPGETCPIALPSMIIRPDTRAECFVAVTSSNLIVAWKKGMFRKTVESEVVPLSAIKKAEVEVGTSGATRGATLMHVEADGDLIFALPKGATDVGNAVQKALMGG